MRLVGANRAAQPDVSTQLPGRSNYFIGHDPAKWRTNVPSFATVKYREVYPGIDVAYHGTKQELEYDFIVAPKADPGAIRLTFDGVTDPVVDQRGDLVLNTGRGVLRKHKPRVYQAALGGEQPVHGAYEIDGTSSVRFTIGPYDKSKPLIIDPVLSYSTYIGSSGDEETGLGSMDVDASGNAYVVGGTSSVDFPTTTGAFDTTFNGGTTDVFVAKFDPNGVRLWSTYLGGTDRDGYYGAGVTVDSSGNVYVAGSTPSRDFVVTPDAFQSVFIAGAHDFNVYLTVLSTAGSLRYSTYVGNGIAENVKVGGNRVYIVGGTDSANFPTLNGAQPAKSGGTDAFLTVFAQDRLQSLTYSTLLGGSIDEIAVGVSIDCFGRAYITGKTYSPDFPTTPTAFQPDLRGRPDVFVAKIDPARVGPGSVEYATHFGPEGFTGVNSIAVDCDGNAYIAGDTDSPNLPTTPGAFQTALAGGVDAFVAKINATGSGLVYATYLGGRGDDDGQVAIDAAGNAYIASATSSTDFPVVNPLQAVNGGGRDAFVAILNSAGTALTFSTYLGGSANDQFSTVVVSPLGDVFLFGQSMSSDFPTTPGAFQTFNAGGWDGIVVKLSTVGDQIASLINMVQSFNLRQGIENSLDAKLLDAQKALAAANGGDRATACNVLAAFINETSAQSGKALTVDQASQLIANARAIRKALGC